MTVIYTTAASETAVAIAKMGTEPICLRRRNRKRQWAWLHRIQSCNQSLQRRDRDRTVGTGLNKYYTRRDYRYQYVSVTIQ